MTVVASPTWAQEERGDKGIVMNDSTFVEDSTQVQTGLVDAKIHLLSRTYGDSIVLRWAAEDYVTWRRLNTVGVDVLRFSHDDPLQADTLAHALKPLSLEAFRQRYPTTDSLAMMAAGMLYDTKGPMTIVTRNPPGTLGALYELQQEQQMRYGLALLTTEWRRDLADALAMRIVDRTVRKDAVYEYMVRPAEPDTTASLIIRTGHIPELKNERCKPEAFMPAVRDSVYAQNAVLLTWNRGPYSSFEIERRSPGSDGWQRVNAKPYIDMSPNQWGEPDSLYAYADRVPTTGLYDYRILAHDAFGDLTEPSPVHRVHVRDITPPAAPDITLIVIDRRDDTDLSKGVFATFHFRKDTLEADYVGFYPVYFHEKNTSGQWQRLTDRMRTPADTTCTIDVTGLSTGIVCTAALDTAGNMSFSIAKMLRIEDMKAPEVPTNLKAETDAEAGTITLTWDAPADEDISSYEVAFANDSTHRFLLASDERVQECRFVDTVDVTTNQKYIYYKVRAIDYSSNVGDYTPVLRVVRPTLLPPAVAHIDSAWTDDRGVHTVWVVSNEHFAARHCVWRKLEKARDWTLLRVCDADSVTAAGSLLRIDDLPPYNREQRYLYAVESFSYSNISSGMSLALSMAWQGDALFSFPIRLMGEYMEKENETRLAWEVDGVPPYPGEWYYCVYRQGPKDSRPRFLITTEADEQTHSDNLLRPDERATYFVKVKYKDGRESLPSNTISVRRLKIEK